MHIVIAHDYAALSRAAADRMIEVVRDRPNASIIVPTGESPLGMYRELAQRKIQGELQTAGLRIFQLDEYVGVREDDPRSLYGWMRRTFLEPLGIASEQVVRLRGDAPDLEEECRAFDRAIEQAGGLDLAILGLGLNGHLGFNEPPSAPDAASRTVQLTPESIAGGARYWGSEELVPTRALTAGMAALLSVRQSLLLVSGEGKGEILRRTVEGPVTTEVPASYLQQATNATIMADREAARSLRGDSAPTV